MSQEIKKTEEAIIYYKVISQGQIKLYPGRFEFYFSRAMIQVMTENPNNPTYYYSCADIELEAADLIVGRVA